MNVTTNKLLALTSEIKVPRFLKKLAVSRGTVLITIGTACGAYVSAIILSSFLVSGMITTLTQKKAVNGSNSVNVNLPPIKSPNYVSIRLAVMNRNLFNSEGEFPEETEEEKSVVNSDGKAFNINAKCQKSTMKLTLLGTIYIGNSSASLATIKEDGFDGADIYKVGDVLIGSENATIAAIERKKVIINNSGVKECLVVNEKDLIREDNVYVDKSKLTNGGVKPQTNGDDVSGDCVTLQSSFVESELGDGFSKIVNAARLVPNMEENQVVGFKIFAIMTSSILGKAGLKNNDIITQVNEVSLKQPEQGFALYEAFQNEREINIHVLRGGNAPKTLCVKIK